LFLLRVGWIFVHSVTGRGDDETLPTKITIERERDGEGASQK